MQRRPLRREPLLRRLEERHRLALFQADRQQAVWMCDGLAAERNAASCSAVPDMQMKNSSGASTAQRLALDAHLALLDVELDVGKLADLLRRLRRLRRCGLKALAEISRPARSAGTRNRKQGSPHDRLRCEHPRRRAKCRRARAIHAKSAVSAIGMSASK
jgi:hypothetical protein